MSIDGGALAMETQSAFMAAAAAVVLLAAALSGRRDRTALVFGALTLCFGIWCGARGAEAMGWARGAPTALLALVGLGALAPANAAAFTGFPVVLGRYRVALWVGPLLLGPLVLAGGAERALVRGAATTWALAGAIAATVVLVRFGPEPGGAPSPNATRLRYLAIAHGIAVLGAGVDVAASQLGGPRVASLLTPLLFLYAAYLHLARVRVADLRQLMGNAVSLSLLALGLAGSFAAVWLWVGPRLELFVFNSFVASFLLLLLLEPSRERIQRAMDRRFVAGRLELERSLNPLQEHLTHVFTLDELLSEVLDTVERANRLRASTVFLRDDPQVGFQQVGSVGLPPRRRLNLIRNPVWVEVLEAGEALLFEELEKGIASTRDNAERARLQVLLRIMRDLDAQLVLPLRTEAQLLGFWTLSDERLTEPFSTSEIQVVQRVAEQLATSIENSKTFERVRARDRLASLGEMATGLAHEIRNPLAAIRGAIAVLQDPEHGEDEELHEVIVEEISRLDRVVGTFLDYARPAGQSRRIKEIGPFVRGCARSVVRSYPDAQIALEFDLADDLPPASANAAQLERVIANLVENAYQALDGKGTVRVAVRRGQPQPQPQPQPDGELSECLEILVEDDGPGMDEATLERALLPFFTTREHGTGLGLALCERLLRAQGGTLQLRSRVGEGTSVLIRLPCHAPESSEATRAEAGVDP